MRLFHGTTLNKFLRAIKKGYYGDEGSVWNVSEPLTTYFWGEKLLREESGCDKTPMTDKELALKNESSVIKEGWYLMGLQFAMESADITLAQERKNMKRIVLVLKQENLDKLNKVEEDISCGVDNSQSLQFSGRIPLDLIKEIWIDKDNLDLYAMYFIGLAHSLNKSRQWGINNYRNELGERMVEACEKVYNHLCEFFFTEFDTPSILEQTSVRKLRRG